MGSEWVTVIAGLGGSLVTGLFGLLMWRVQRRKWDAEVDRTNADTDKVEAETQTITSQRLIQELDRIAQINVTQGQLIEQQRIEIDTLRTQVLAYATKEARHAMETAALRARIAELEGKDDSTTSQILRRAFPPEISHEPNEFDPPDGPAAPDAK